MLSITNSKDGFSFNVKVIPRSSQCKIVGLLDGAVKVKLTAPPVSGKANEALIRFFADVLEINRNELEIVSGQTSSHKRIFVRTTDSSVSERLIALSKTT